MHADENITLDTEAPNLATAAAEGLVRRIYGIDGEADLLAAERDQNFLIRAAPGERYVLKISNASEPVAVVDFQIAALDHIARIAPALPVPHVVRTLAGGTRDVVQMRNGSRSTVRMLTYLDGIQVRATGRSSAQRRAMGNRLAELNTALQGFAHPGAAHDLLWNVATAHRLRDKLDSIPAPKRKLADLYMDRFTNTVLPRLPRLRAQVIHNDYHFYNVLVAADNHASVTGIIDFGDMVEAPLVAEVATAASYHMAGEADPLAAAAEFVGAYHSILPLNAAEQEVVTDLVATRHLITVLISEWRAIRYAENRDYIMRHNPGAWQALALMADLSRDECRDRLLAKINSGDSR